MSNQVHLNPTKLAILSIPREKLWLFTSSILRLLRTESSIKQSLSDDSDLDSMSDSSEYESETDHSYNDSSLDEFGGHTEALRRQRSDNGVDNSSKPYRSSTPQGLSDSEEETEEEDGTFFHIALTPTECTVICSSALFKELFTDSLSVCKKLEFEDVVIVDEPFINLQVDSDGETYNSSRILELTRPLSENNIPLFFLSSHFTDIVLIPYKVRNQVVEILTNKSFEFSDISNSYIANLPAVEQKLEDLNINSTELEDKTSKLFKENNIRPKISKRSRLLLTGARPGKVKEAIDKAAMCIGSGSVPGYFVITRTSLNELSLVLPGSSRQRVAMGFDFKSIIGSASDIIFPISIDFRSLPLDLTGVVAGLAGRIFRNCEADIEMSYLSMARSGVLMIPEENLESVASVVNSINNMD
ncbi:hypothetical protein ACI3LY_001729 [Candidozyma auris]